MNCWIAFLSPFSLSLCLSKSLFSIESPGEAWIERTAKQSPTQEEAPHRSTEKARRRGEHRTQETGSGEGGRTCNECKGEARALNTTSVKIGRQKEESFNKVNIVKKILSSVFVVVSLFSFSSSHLKLELTWNWIWKNGFYYLKKKKKNWEKKQMFLRINELE